MRALGQDLTYTIAWALFAIAMLIVGIAKGIKPARIASLALLVIAIAKCFLHDLMRLGGLYRVGSLVGLAVSLAVVALLLQRFVLSKVGEWGERRRDGKTTRRRDDPLGAMGPVSQVGDRAFSLDSAYQGREALAMVKKAREAGWPYALAFVDMKMPPGWDGLETIEAIWAVDDEIQVVICTAHSDHSWDSLVSRIGQSDRLLVIKKPFDAVEVAQATYALTEKWRLAQLTRMQLEGLEEQVRVRTAHLEKANEELETVLNDRDRIEVELRLSQKLQAVGQLAAGIAHEINTPIQFVGDSVGFLEKSFQALLGLLADYDMAIAGWMAGDSFEKHGASLEQAREDADLEYVIERSTAALERTRDGAERVATIVRAMKGFGHPDSRDKELSDINQGIKNTLEVARNEYKYVADVELDLTENGEIVCYPSDLNQVVLNLVVNAAHAIAEAIEERGRGKITVSTEREGEIFRIIVEDTGPGIPEEVGCRMFDPFFTTKAVGKGTGQGLAIAHSVVVDKHFGDLRFESRVGKGTKFIVELPKDGTTRKDLGGGAQSFSSSKP